jgi:hydrogenase maturation protease
MKRALVIGYGNTLRADDGAGIVAAERLSGRFPNVDVVTVHELQPELADTMSRYATVIFLDAAMEGSGIRTMGIEPPGNATAEGSHGHSPGALLTLCRKLYGHAPDRSLLIAIPGKTFDFGERLSDFTEGMIEQAIEEVGRYLVS